MCFIKILLAGVDPDRSTRPILAGRNFPTALIYDVGNAWRIRGKTRRMVTKMLMAAAVWRTMYPMPSANSPSAVRYNPPEMTARSAPGLDRVAYGADPDRMA